MSESRIQRVQVLDNVVERLEKFFGPSGTVRPLLRAVKRGPWKPGNPMRPAATVVDYGAKKTGGKNSDAGKNRTMSFQVVIDLAADLGRADLAIDWSQEIERIRMAVQNMNACACCLRLDVISDDPIEVLLSESESELVWVLECEAEYFEEGQAFGTAEETVREWLANM